MAVLVAVIVIINTLKNESYHEIKFPLFLKYFEIQCINYKFAWLSNLSD